MLLYNTLQVDFKIRFNNSINFICIRRKPIIGVIFAIT